MGSAARDKYFSIANGRQEHNDDEAGQEYPDMENHSASLPVQIR
jgi:hypothetical protein